MEASSDEHSEEVLEDSSERKVKEVVDTQKLDERYGQKHPKEAKQNHIPVLFPRAFPKRTTLLVQIEDSNIDLSGDIGAIGRIHADTDTNTIMLDIKGQQYSGELVPCNTYMVLGIGNNEAKVESIVNDFCQITTKKNVLNTIQGVVVDGTMDDTYVYSGEVDVNKASSVLGTTTNSTGANRKRLNISNPSSTLQGKKCSKP